MRYFYDEPGGARVARSRDELRQLHLGGVVKPDTLVTPEGAEASVIFSELWAQWQDPQQQSARLTRRSPRGLAKICERSRRICCCRSAKRGIELVEEPKADRDCRRWPCAALDTRDDVAPRSRILGNGALFFGALGAVFLPRVSHARARVSTSALCFFATGVLSISVLLMLYHLPPLMWVAQLFKSPSQFSHMLAYSFGIALPEELCKALPLFVLLKRSDPLPPQVMLFYGLMSGLGFGIYEGVDYQMERNFRYAEQRG